jgi:hypothetical protein
VIAESWFQRYLLPDWSNDQSPDEHHPHRRRFTKRYRRKQGIVKNIWVCSGVLMLAHATPEAAIALGLGTTFLSFVILDETP